MTALVGPKSTAPFVTRLRVRGETIDIARAGEPALTLRVEMPEVWDTVRIRASANEPVISVKRAALEALAPQADMAEEFVLKLRGWEILDERATLTDAGAIDGSIFLVAYRRRRAVR